LRILVYAFEYFVFSSFLKSIVYVLAVFNVGEKLFLKKNKEIIIIPARQQY